jgi:transcriptional regulator with XRE-family HTH domain
MKTLSERLHHALSTRGKSPAELARAVKKTESAVSQWLSGETKSLRSESLISTCNFLRCQPAWLSSGELPTGLDATNETNEPSETSDIEPPTKSNPSYTFAALELAAIFDMIPVSDLLLRAEAFSLASTALAEVVRRSQAKHHGPAGPVTPIV